MLVTRSSAPKHRPATEPANVPAHEAWALIVQIVKAARTRHLAEFELTPAQAQLLLNIDPARPAPMNELAGTLGCDASNVTGLVDRLEARALIERQPDAHDRRVKMVAITSAGSRVQKKLHERWFEPPEPIAGMSERDQAALLAILRRATGSVPGGGMGGREHLQGNGNG